MLLRTHDLNVLLDTVESVQCRCVHGVSSNHNMDLSNLAWLKPTFNCPSTATAKPMSAVMTMTAVAGLVLVESFRGATSGSVVETVLLGWICWSVVIKSGSAPRRRRRPRADGVTSNWMPHVRAMCSTRGDGTPPDNNFSTWFSLSFPLQLTV